MSRAVTVDVFAEDQAHEAWLRPAIIRMAREISVRVQVQVRSARGGHGRVTQELELYQRAITSRLTVSMPDLVVVAIDSNCTPFADVQKDIRKSLRPEIGDSAVLATPEPHIERWFLADLQAFHQVVGTTPSVPSRRCERGFYKQILSRAVTNAGHPSTLGGIEFAEELVEAFDFYRAGRTVPSLRRFLQDLRTQLQQRKI